jgi:hypothetical protein
MWHAWERRGKCIGFWWESQKERGDLENQNVDGRKESEWIFREIGWGNIEWILVGSGFGSVAGFCEYDYKPSGSGATELDLQ